MKGEFKVSAGWFGKVRRTHLLGFLLVPVLAIGVGVVAPKPASRAAERAVVDDFIFEKSDDNLLGVTDTRRGLRLEVNIDATSTQPQPTEANLRKLMAETQGLVKTELGWDLSSRAERDRIRAETVKLAQVLHGIPEETLQKKENQALRALRDVADGLVGTAPCRGRCLPEAGVTNRIIAVGVAGVVNHILNNFIDADSTSMLIAIVSLSVFAGAVTEFTFQFGPAITGIPRADLQRSVITGAMSLLIIVNSYLYRARSLAAQGAATVRAAARKAVQEVVKADPTPPSESVNDYDTVHDEL